MSVGNKKTLAAVLAAGGLSLVAAGVPVNCGDKLQVMWDDAIVDGSRTTAARLLHHPIYAGTAMV